MALNKRGRTATPSDEAIEAFTAQAELPPSEATPKARLPKKPSRAPKTSGINFRMTENQMALLRAAAAHEDLSQQKVLERIVWPVLEERYGLEIN